jgi:hypothetical protein
MKPRPENQLLKDFASTERLRTRIDADGTLIIPGKFGNIYEFDNRSLAVMVIPVRVRKNYWAITRNKLVDLGLVMTQNGDCEGAAVFDSSNREQAKAAIQAAGISRKRQLSPAQINRQITWLRTAAGVAL